MTLTNTARAAEEHAFSPTGPSYWLSARRSVTPGHVVHRAATSERLSVIDHGASVIRPALCPHQPDRRDRRQTRRFPSIGTTDQSEPLRVTCGTGNTVIERGHTGPRSGVAAQGPQAANGDGVINQTNLAGIIRRALDL